MFKFRFSLIKLFIDDYDDIEVEHTESRVSFTSDQRTILKNANLISINSEHSNKLIKI